MRLFVQLVWLTIEALWQDQNTEHCKPFCCIWKRLDTYLYNINTLECLSSFKKHRPWKSAPITGCLTTNISGCSAPHICWIINLFVGHLFPQRVLCLAPPNMTSHLYIFVVSFGALGSTYRSAASKKQHSAWMTSLLTNVTASPSLSINMELLFLGTTPWPNPLPSGPVACKTWPSHAATALIVRYLSIKPVLLDVRIHHVHKFPPLCRNVVNLGDIKW